MLEKHLIFPGDARRPRFACGRGGDAVSAHPRER